MFTIVFHVFLWLKELSGYVHSDGTDVNVSITYKTGESDVHPHFNVFLKWDGMEVYPAWMSSVMATCLSVNMMANDIDVLFIDNEHHLKVYM